MSSPIVVVLVVGILCAGFAWLVAVNVVSLVDDVAVVGPIVVAVVSSVFTVVVSSLKALVGCDVEVGLFVISAANVVVCVDVDDEGVALLVGISNVQ